MLVNINIKTLSTKVIDPESIQDLAKRNNSQAININVIKRVINKEYSEKVTKVTGKLGHFFIMKLFHGFKTVSELLQQVNLSLLLKNLKFWKMN